MIYRGLTLIDMTVGSGAFSRPGLTTECFNVCLDLPMTGVRQLDKLVKAHVNTEHTVVPCSAVCNLRPRRPPGHCGAIVKVC